MIINDLDGYYIVFDTKNWNTELDTLVTYYKIPIYQRNYAWERDEISALIKDIYDSMVIDKPIYYIGTLVTFKRDENVFEVIDGQQRLTTIYIVLTAMGESSIRPDKSNRFRCGRY